MWDRVEWVWHKVAKPAPANCMDHIRVIRYPCVPTYGSTKPSYKAMFTEIWDGTVANALCGLHTKQPHEVDRKSKIHQDLTDAGASQLSGTKWLAVYPPTCDRALTNATAKWEAAAHRAAGAQTCACAALINISPQIADNSIGHVRCTDIAELITLAPLRASVWMRAAKRTLRKWCSKGRMFRPIEGAVGHIHDHAGFT